MEERQERWRKSCWWIICIVLCIMSGVTAKAEQITTPDQIYQNNVEKYNSARTDVSALSYYLLDRGTVPAPENVTELTKELVKNCNNDMEKLQKIHDWVAGNIGYDNYGIHNKTYTIAPDEVLEKRVTICEGYALLTASMCHAAGIPCKVVSGYANGNSQGIGEWTEEIIAKITLENGHAWNEAYVESRWVILDTTWDSKMRNTIESAELLYKDEFERTYFDMSLEKLSKTYWTWDNCDGEIESQYSDSEPLCYTVAEGIKVSWEQLESNTTYTLQYSTKPFEDYTDYMTTKEKSVVFDKALVTENELYFRVYATDNYWFPNLYSECSKWEKQQYSVVFMDGNNVVNSQKVECWQSAVTPDYAKEGYTLEWDREYSCICQDMTICAKWTKSASDSNAQSDASVKENQDRVQAVDKKKSLEKVKNLKLKNTKGRKVVIQWSKVNDAVGYQVQYCNSKSFKKAKSAYVRKNKYTAKKLKKKKTYYVRVRAYRIQDGKKSYGKWSKTGKVKIKE